MGLYSGKDKKTAPEERLKALLINTVQLFTEGYSEWYNSDHEFLQYLYSELGTDEADMKELEVDLSNIL